MTRQINRPRANGDTGVQACPACGTGATYRGIITSDRKHHYREVSCDHCYTISVDRYHAIPKD